MDPKEMLAEVSKIIDKQNESYTKKADEVLAAAQAGQKISDTVKAEVDKMAAEFNGLRQQYDTVSAQLRETEQAVAGLKISPNGAGAGAPVKSAGTLVKEYESLKDFAKNVQASSRLSVPVPRAAIISTDLATNVIAPNRLPGIQPLLHQRLFVRDLISPGRTESPLIYWVRTTGFTNAAAIIPAENTAKPYSGLTFDVQTTPVATIAHMFKASKQVLDDFTQLGSIIDSEMQYGLKLVEENELLLGTGTGGHLHGIIPQATAYAPAFAVEAQSPIDDLRLAMLQSQLARIPATGHVLHYTDWARIELLKDTLGRYIIGNPQGTLSPSLWNLPVVTTEVSALLGKFLTGAFKLGAQIFDREDANVVISTENVDDFEKNMVSIRCEERLGLAVYRPQAFIYGTLTAAASS